MIAIGIIPARYSSSRFPGKPLAKILGMSLIERVYQRAILSGLDKVLVATDDHRIENEILSFGGNVVMTGEHVSGTDRVAEACKNEKCDIVVNIQGDEPLINPEVINTVIKSLKANTWADISTAATIITNKYKVDDPNIVKVVFNKEGKSIYFSRSRIPYNRSLNTDYYKRIGIYAYKKEFLNKFVELPQSNLEISESLEQLRAIENNYNIHVSVVEYDSIGVDIPSDIKNVEDILKKKRYDSVI